MNVRGIRDDQDDELPVVGGVCDALFYPDDVILDTDADREAWRAEIAAKMAKKRPAGFAAWPEQADETQRLRIVS